MIDTIEVESLFIEIPCSSTFGVQSVIVISGSIYCPSDTDVAIFNDVLSSTLELINIKGKACVLLDDFNIDMLKTESNLSTEFFNLLYTLYLYSR